MELYSRIIISNSRDHIDKLYPLIIDYLHHPERAASVKEVILQTPFRRPFYFTQGPHPHKDTAEADEARRNISSDTDVRNALRILHLNNAEEDDWVRILSWMSPELVDARKAAKHTIEDDGSAIEGWQCSRDSLFAQYAGVLLLMMCPNVEKLIYEDNGGPVETILKQNNYAKLPNLHLQHLREVEFLPIAQILINDPRCYTKMDPIALTRLFHRLPALESISMAAVSVSGGAGYQEFVPPGISNVKHLRLEHVEFPTSMTGDLIRMSKSLEEFTLTEGGRWTNDGGHFAKHRRTIAKALACHRSTLRKLDLDVDDLLSGIRLEEEDRPQGDHDDGLWADDYVGQDVRESSSPRHVWDLKDTRQYHGTVGPMRDFECLTHLSIGVKLLLGLPGSDKAPHRLVDMLPTTLEFLLIRGYKKGQVAKYDDEIEALKQARPARFPVLSEIRGIDECIPSGEEPDECADEPYDPDDSDDPDGPRGSFWKREEVDQSWLVVTNDAV